ncbi:MAG: 30S ribosomal protein S20 [Candidatus Saccharicenans sp.]|nr:30S ribosomal protein S20 [Candidatus Saccharicenans sp.]MDH7493175.1 30S ribosomal protein S20 [Candidatus Saccharicenans sp.]
MTLRHKSAIRQHRRSLRRRAVNQRNKSLMKTMIKKLRETINNSDREAALALLPQVFKAIDKAVAKGAIKKNTGSRYKSRLSRQVQSLPVKVS